MNKISAFLKSLVRGKADVFARYETMREAISGTMSKFYMARDRKTDEIVGLKILDKKQSEALAVRLKDAKKPCEGEIGASIDHPNVVKVIEYGETTSGEEYLVMEYVDGPGLNSLLFERSRLLEGKRLALLRQAAEALSAVHTAGYIHRDVCPRNFVVNQAGTSLKLIDFGLSVPATPPFMRPGNRSGTPSYMAPEIVRRKSTDERVDIFAFGVTAYELCTFHLPWVTSKDGQGALAHDTVEPTPIAEHRPGINPRLAETIMRCLAASADDRPRSMDDVLKSIASVRHEDQQA